MKIKHKCKMCADWSKDYADLSKKCAYWSKMYADRSKKCADWSKEYAIKCDCEAEDEA